MGFRSERKIHNESVIIIELNELCRFIAILLIFMLYKILLEDFDCSASDCSIMMRSENWEKTSVNKSNKQTNNTRN